MEKLSADEKVMRAVENNVYKRKNCSQLVDKLKKFMYEPTIRDTKHFFRRLCIAVNYQNLWKTSIR